MKNQAPPEQLTISVCSTLDEIHQCQELQRAIWHDTDEDLTPTAIFVVAGKTGGHVLLARHGSKPVGFALAFPAFRGDLRCLHSHIVGVVPEYQNRSLGRMIKLKQRALMLEMQLALMEWTFDPLALRNAYFNIVRLGAIVRQFHANLYGVTSSPLHSGLPTDRLLAEWHVSSSRVQNALAGSAPVVAPDAIQIVVPAEMEEWRNSGSRHAEEVQARLKAGFQKRFAQGFAVTGFRMENGNGIYLLERYEGSSDSASRVS
jgi:predicted GNAT superfamily acetyltransferase